MFRFLAMALTVVLATQAAPAFAQSINVSGKLSNGNSVTAVCSVGANGNISGTGVMSGTNPSSGYSWSYPFIINKGVTKTGKLVLTGTFVGAGYPVTLSATVPNGPLTFSYIVKGQVVTMSGTGTVTVK